MSWKDSLTDDELFHLDMNCIQTLDTFKDVIATQKRDGIDCPECRRIARKLGLDLDTTPVPASTNPKYHVGWFLV